MLQLAEEALHIVADPPDHAYPLRLAQSRQSSPVTCAWCGRLIAEDEPVQTLGLAAGPQVDLSELRGSWVPFPLLSGKIVPAMVSSEDSPAKRDGWDLILMTCGEACAARLKEALEQEREWFEASRGGD